MSNERLFWLALVAGIIFSRVVGGSGLLHHFWPAFFDPPVASQKVSFGEFGPYSVQSTARIAQAATETVAQGVAHG